jgi:hypothetical protein
MKRALLLAGAALLAAPAAQARGRAPDYQEVAVADAIAYWTRLCVATMPDRRAFAAALAAEPGWVQFRKRQGGHPVLGLFWRSPRGELSYQDTPLPTETNQGCHYTFRTGAGFSHDGAAQALVDTLGLDRGRPESTARRASTRWEGTLPNGTRVRIFLSSGASELGGPAATLSISAYRDAGRNR